MGQRPFTTFDDQIHILKNRSLNFKNELFAKEILSRVNYYNVINGYKEPFLKKDLSGKRKDPEEYIEGCYFEELYALYEMDRRLRIIMLEYLLMFENYFKTSCSYYFSKKFPKDYSYLSIDNYSKSEDSLSVALNNLSTISNEINRSSGDRKAKSDYIRHYIKKHDCVPLWVLVNSLTIGNMSYFYSAIDDSLKEEIAKSFSFRYKESYSTKEKVGSEEIKEIVKAVNFFRNICAHDEMLFSFKLKSKLKTELFSKFFPEIIFNGQNLHDLVCLLKLALPKEEYEKLIISIDDLFEKNRINFQSVSIDQIVELAGFKQGWKEKLIENMD